MKQDSFAKLTLLYVDDEDSVRANAVEYFGRIFGRVIEAKDGIEAFAVYAESRPDVVVTDIKMPKQNGLEFVKNVRKFDKKTPIVVLTAFTDTAYLMEAVELQLIKYIVKPMSEEKISTMLRLIAEALTTDNSHIYHLADRITYDSFSKSLFLDETPVKLTKSELLLLDLLVRNSHRSVAYREIENFIWSDDVMSIGALRSLVRALRKKLPIDIIENISGVGYKIISTHKL